MLDGCKLKKIGIKYHEGRVSQDCVRELAAWLEARGKDVTPVCGKNCVIPPDRDLLIVMGGDGTLLGGARAAAVHGIPLLGIDFGGLGFLSEIPYDQAFDALEHIFKGEYRVEERLMLEAVITRPGENLPPFPAVNDVVVTRHSGRMLRLKVRINGAYFHEFPGDGLILSTSTGSTAYALSAGGPIVSPELDVVSLTPICPHTLFARAIITSGDDVIDIELPARRNDLLLSLDGQEEFELKPGDAVTVRRAPHRVRYIRVADPNFFERVRVKFKLT